MVLSKIKQLYRDILQMIRYFKVKRTFKINKRPSDWKYKMSDLLNEVESGKRKSIEPYEFNWASEYEQSLHLTHVRPADWKYTISDLVNDMQSGKRKFIEPFECEWAREYEQSLIPDDVRYPKKGNIYESLEDQTVGYLTSYKAPYTGGGDGTLLKGEQIWIWTDPAGEKPLAGGALPIEYEKMEERIVSKEERESSKYAGFQFVIPIVDLNSKFKLVGIGYQKEGKRN